MRKIGLCFSVMAFLAIAASCGGDGEEKRDAGGSNPADSSLVESAGPVLADAGPEHASGEVPPVEVGGPYGGTDAPLDLGVVDADGSASHPIDLAPASPTVCAIAAKLASTKPDASDTVMPSTHEFSLLIDWAGNTAATGSGGTAERVSLTHQDGVWTTQGPLVLSLGLAGSKVGNRPFITYEQISISPTTIGCTGTATGTYEWSFSDTIWTIPFRAVLAGVNDWDVPVLSVLPDTSPVHPLDLNGIAVTELLPVGTTAEWLGSASAPPVPMTALPVGSTVGVSGFLFEGRALAFGQSYWLRVTPGAADLAGNLTSKLVAVVTTPDPGLFAQDSFETAVNALQVGKVRIVDATVLPIPTGAKALRFAPTSAGMNTDWACSDRFTARLAVASGAAAVKFRAYPYEPTGGKLAPFHGRVRLASPNGAVSDSGRYAWTSQGVAVPNWTVGTVPTDPTLTRGTLTEHTFALPPGTGAEVIVDIQRICMEPSTASTGLVIDDLRVE
jgi:hypothetical protein